ncbi:phage integrase SAM-like domain-containing protein [Treponema sp. OttesenSCG-928-L16]|nr:phage integrase SAM-like domain-containing protein [Treponema sp. OttesenSCG-928-L16]
MNKVLKYLEPYPGGAAIQLGQVNERWFEGFQSYLEKESGLSKNTANSYAFAVRLALNKAVHENLIPRNPSESVKSIRSFKKKTVQQRR